MKVYRAKEARTEPREGFSLGFLAQVGLPEAASSVGFFRPAVPAHGHLRSHYHEKITEFMFFPGQARVKCGNETLDVGPGDLVIFAPGEIHEVFAGPEGITPLVVKLPNDPSDSKLPQR